MTIGEALAKFKTLHPSGIDDKILVDFLSELDGRVADEILESEDPAGMGLPYKPDQDRGKTLLAPFPYDSMYGTWLQTKTDFHNNEYDRFNNDMIQFNTEWTSYANNYLRKHSSTQANQMIARL